MASVKYREAGGVAITNPHFGMDLNNLNTNLLRKAESSIVQTRIREELNKLLLEYQEPIFKAIKSENTVNTINEDLEIVRSQRSIPEINMRKPNAPKLRKCNDMNGILGKKILKKFPQYCKSKRRVNYHLASWNILGLL